MKTKFYPELNLWKFFLSLAFLVLSISLHAQPGQGGCSGPGPCLEGLKFTNGSYQSGTGSGAGTINAEYKFQQVSQNLDAIVKIVDRSSSQVTLTNIDLSNTGWDKALQPQVAYNNGNVSGSKNWWMEFSVTFRDRSTGNTVVLDEFDVTALDIDGDNDELREVTSFFSPNTYTLESNSLLSVSNLLQTILTVLTPVGKTFKGTYDDYSGIDTSATQLMTTLNYEEVSSIKFRLGGETTGSSNNANRMYALWFKSFTYNLPITLPVKLSSFTATLNQNKVDLKWTTVTEENLSHFVIERSTDGVNFSDAGMVFAYGSTAGETRYNFSDNLSSTSAKVVYYRLRSVDVDGKAQYSDTRIIRLSSNTGISILAYPNPVTTELRVTIPENWQNKKVVYELFTLGGVSTQKREVIAAGQTETLNVNTLTKGMYLVRATCGDETAQQKFIKH